MNYTSLIPPAQVLLWCSGRLAELCEEGLVTAGRVQITTGGKLEFERMKADGYLPGRADAREAIVQHEFVAGEDADTMLNLMFPSY